MSGFSPRQLDELRRRTGGRILGGRIEHVDSCPSTQDLVRERGDQGEPEGLVVVADHQTHGRGRRGHTWTQERGRDLSFSCLVTPPPSVRPIALAALLPVAVVLGLEHALGQRLALKWPNDVLWAGRKLAGILIEAAGARHVVGVGINVNTTRFPGELGNVAVAAREIVRREVDRVVLLAAVLVALDDTYAAIRRGEWTHELDALRDRLGILGRTVEIVTGAGSRRGVVTDLDLDGIRLAETGGAARTVALEIVSGIVAAGRPGPA